MKCKKREICAEALAADFADVTLLIRACAPLARARHATIELVLPRQQGALEPRNFAQIPVCARSIVALILLDAFSTSPLFATIEMHVLLTG